MRALPILAAITITAAISAQSTSRASVDVNGFQADFGNEHPVVTHDGRYVVFTSAATNLGPADTNGATDIYRKDLQTGAVVLVSVDGSSALANGSSIAPSISADGRYVSFFSEASNLTAFDTNAAFDVFLRDIASGTTTLVSQALGGPQSGNGASLQQCISGDGRYVAFYSTSTDLVAVDLNGTTLDAFVFDRTTGAIELASLSSAGAQGNGSSYEPATFLGPGLSDDGRYVAFTSEASNLVPGDTNQATDIFVRDRVLGTTVRASENAAGFQGNLDSRSSTISADGRWVAFGSDANNLVPNDTGPFDYFVKDLRTGVVDRVSVVTGGGQGAGGGFHLYPTDYSWISADGRFVTFGHKYTNLSPGDTNTKADVFRHDRWLVRTERASSDSSGGLSDNHSTSSSMSEDGKLVVFASSATNLVASDTNAATDVFLRTLPVPYTSFCFGDGAAGVTACPCSNPGSYRHGCENSSNTSGAVVFADGTASVAADTITLYAARVRAYALCNFLQATNQVNGGFGIQAGDGIRCIGGVMVRLGSHSASRTGLAAFGSGVPGDPKVSVRGMIPTAGTTRHYQVLYRDGAAFCPSSSLNYSNAMSIVWTP